MHDATFLGQTVLLFGAALFVAWLLRRFGAPSVIGFLVSGLVIGPTGLHLVTAGAVGQFAELGLVLLLFTVGLELSPKPLFQAGRRLLVAAGLQIGVTALIAFLAVRWVPHVPLFGAVLLGFVVSLSSTAIVLKQLSDLRTTDSPAGVLTTGILLLQDVFAILLMLFLPLLGSAKGMTWQASAWHAMFSIAGLIVVVVVARKILPTILSEILSLGGQELSTLFCVVMACAGAWLAGLAGWSWALGACIAGLLLSQSDARHQLFADIMPFRDVFNALFFISMGMLVDLPAAVPYMGWLAAAIIATVIGKAALTSGAILIAGWPMRLAITVGIGLCTVSEFGFVLAREARLLKLVPGTAFNLVTAYAVGTMMIGAVLVPIADRFAAWVSGSGVSPAMNAGDVARCSLRGHVIIIGYGLNGQNLSRVLRAMKIPQCVIEMNRSLARIAIEERKQVIIGDAARSHILDHAGLESARALVIAIHDAGASRAIIAHAHAARPDLYILARTRFVKELDTLYALGARQVIPEEFETSIEIFAHVLKEFSVPDHVIDEQIVLVRKGNYKMLRKTPGSLNVAQGRATN